MVVKHKYNILNFIMKVFGYLNAMGPNVLLRTPTWSHKINQKAEEKQILHTSFLEINFYFVKKGVKKRTISL